ncbi:ubiquinol-cytochrome-c reductase complex subunit-domain-containing protein [Lasiosphaeria hispida]|uniref:Ubiquinol-cytochrome-c reductase complex subunit-domain-containing protein n=1 Tax=Lasiosphaeria hispida TaxID=260671 RepID=A0AAJ0HGJ3_9PEZI|nr:ubiquinol-cytochrome-c reductase complex subunit-domain-containing protein [Lasiosphaeria hispida]
MPSPTPVLRSAAFKSNYGPKYTFQPHVGTITPKSLFRFGVKAGAFGGVALFAVIFLTSGIPKIQDDILKKVPFLKNSYDRSVPASDSPF